MAGRPLRRARNNPHFSVGYKNHFGTLYADGFKRAPVVNAALKSKKQIIDYVNALSKAERTALRNRSIEFIPSLAPQHEGDYRAFMWGVLCEVLNIDPRDELAATVFFDHELPEWQGSLRYQEEADEFLYMF